MALHSLVICNGIHDYVNDKYSYAFIEKLSNVVVCLLAWCFFSYSFVYGNCLAEQKRYTEYHFQLALSDIVNIEELSDGDITKIYQSGSIGLSPIVKRVAGNNTLIERTIGYNIPGNGNEGNLWFKLYYGLGNLEMVDEDAIKDNGIIVSDKITHRIRISGDVLVIDWKDEE